MMRAIWLYLALLLFCSGCLPKEPPPPAGAPSAANKSAVATEFAAEAAPTAANVCAVGPEPAAALKALVATLPVATPLAFTGLKSDGGDGLAALVSRKLEPLALEACRARGLKLLDRENLRLVIEEWKLSQSGITTGDPGAMELLDARVVLTGTVGRENDRVHIFFKAIDLKSGEILAAAEAFQPASLYPVSAEAGPVGQAGSGLVRLSSNAASYKMGQPISLAFEVSEPGYVTLIDINPRGEKAILFPNPYQTDNYCRPGTTYRVPPGQGDFVLEVAGPPGVDRIMALFHDRPEALQVVMAYNGAAFTRALVEKSRGRAMIQVEID